MMRDSRDEAKYLCLEEALQSDPTGFQPEMGQTFPCERPVWTKAEEARKMPDECMSSDLTPCSYTLIEMAKDSSVSQP